MGGQSKSEWQTEKILPTYITDKRVMTLIIWKRPTLFPPPKKNRKPDRRQWAKTK